MDVPQRFAIPRVVDAVFRRRDGDRDGTLALPGAACPRGGKADDEVSLRLKDRLLLTTARALGYDVPKGIDAAAIAARADTNGDRRICRPEATAYLQGLDADRDGALDRLELTAALAALRAGPGR